MACVNELYIVSYNMHGFNQGIEVVRDLVNSTDPPDIVLLQEHWLTPSNLFLFGEKINSHFAFGKSAMSDCVTQGPLLGRPFGGTSILIKNELRVATKCIFCSDRYVVIRVGNLLIFNIYLPCVGTMDRIDIVEDILQEVWSWRLKYTDCATIIGGDFNTDLEKCNSVSSYINNFLTNNSLRRCDIQFPSRRQNTYVNESLGHCSVIDYFVSDASDGILDYCVLDPDINLSDHLPVAIRCKCTCQPVSSAAEVSKGSKVKQLRWDHADLLSYYNTTMSLLYPLYYELIEFENVLSSLSNADCNNFIDNYYSKLVGVLNYSAELHVPAHYKNYYKFWWSQELSCLKDNAIKSNKNWKEAGRPRTGPIADRRNADKRKYKSMLRKERRSETQSYTNDLHDALISKSGVSFWKCWKAKFEKKNKASKLIDGLADDTEIAEAFAKHFRTTCSSFNEGQSNHLRSVYSAKRQDYVGDPFLDEYKFNVELVETVFSKLKRGKAAGLDELTIEHLVNSHPVLVVILAKFFNIIVSAAYVPHGFRLSYTVPLLKEDQSHKGHSIDNYRAISISPIISKIFEHCVLTRYNKFLMTSPNQFGFKKASSCGHAIYSVRKVVDHYAACGSTVNVCLLDLSKAFDKMDHFALYLKLMDRSIPVQILNVLENWFSLCLSCVKWGSVMSHFYELKAGVRQGGVLSPILFGIYIDVLVKLVNRANIGCKTGAICTGIFLYADDIILLAPSVQALQSMISICESELNYLCMAVNAKKSACLRFGPRYKNGCANVMVSGHVVNWVTSARYLGVYLESSFTFRCSFAVNKAKFYMAFNCIFGKIGGIASEEVIFALIKSKCLPILLYGTEACPTNSTVRHSLDFAINKLMFKIFGALSKDTCRDICNYFGIRPIEEQISARQSKFILRYCASESDVCRAISKL